MSENIRDIKSARDARPSPIDRESLGRDRPKTSLDSGRGYLAEAAPILRELADIGFDVNMIGELRRPGRPRYAAAVPILERWLPRVSSPSLKDDIIRTLSVPWAKEAVPALVAEFENIETNSRDLRWVVGNALWVHAKHMNPQELLRLARDPRFGSARQMVVMALGGVKAPGVVDVLVGLLEDEDLLGHALYALGRGRAVVARAAIERQLVSPRAYVRNNAKKALTQIDRELERLDKLQKAPRSNS
jgi:hypothetical protein